MPYIHTTDRPGLDPTQRIGFERASTSGELNFQITRLCDDYLRGKLSYAEINAVIGVLECAKLEFYRRIAATYEDSKIQQNGDVYESREG